MRQDPSKIIPTSSDTSEVWVEWHKALKKWFSKDEANTHFVRFWNQRGGAGTDADTVDLRKYMESQGVNLSTTRLGHATDMVMGGLEFLGTAFKVVIIIIIVGAVVAISLHSYKTIKSTQKVVALR